MGSLDLRALGVCSCLSCAEQRAWRRAYWTIARARVRVARRNAIAFRIGIREAIDELDRYLDRGAPAGWSGDPLVFLPANL